MNEESLFTFNIYLIGAVKTEEQLLRITEVGNFIKEMFDKLTSAQLSGCIGASTIQSSLEFLKRMEQSDLMVVIADELNSDSIFQIGYACKLGIPILLFTENPSTKIGPFIASGISCFVNTKDQLNVMKIFITQAYEAKMSMFDEYMHVSKLQADLNNEIALHKEEEEKAEKEHADVVKVFQLKHESIEKESEAMYARQNGKIDALSKYRTQTLFIGTIE